MADANEHILTGNLGSALTGSKWDLGLEEVSHRAWGAKPPNTNIRGKDPIDGVWASSTLEVVGFKILSFYSSVGEQSLRHIQTHGLNTTPKYLTIEDLLRQLQIWKRQGDQIIFMADANEHILTGNLGAALTGSKWDLGLEEVSHRAWGAKPPNTNIRGRDPIDGVWASSTLEVVGFKILSFYSSVGDHQGMVFDISA